MGAIRPTCNRFSTNTGKWLLTIGPVGRCFVVFSGPGAMKGFHSNEYNKDYEEKKRFVPMCCVCSPLFELVAASRDILLQLCSSAEAQVVSPAGRVTSVAPQCQFNPSHLVHR